MSYNPNNPNGQATMANSAPVVLASDQSSINTSIINTTASPIPIQPPLAGYLNVGIDGSHNTVAATLNSGSAIIGKVGIDQTTVGTTNAVSVAQLGANTVNTGNGTAGTGTLRVAIASDNTANTNPFLTTDSGTGSTGSAVPTKAGYIGGIAKTSNPTAASDGNLTGALMDKLGKQVVVGSIRDLKTDATVTLTASVAETTLLAQSASIFNDLYGAIVVNTSATATEVSFRDTTAGSVRFTIYVPAGETRGFMLPESAAWKQATVNTNWTIQSSASVSSVKVHALFIKNI